MQNPLLSSNTLQLDLPDGTFDVLDAWDHKPSRYHVTINRNSIVSFGNNEHGADCDADQANRWLARGFAILRALSASTGYPSAGPGREEEFMMTSHQ